MSDERPLDEIEELEKLAKERQEFLADLSHRKELKRLSDLKKVLSIVEGRRFVWRLMYSQGPVSADPGSPAFTYQHGQRANASALWDDIVNNFPDQFLRMRNEAASDQKVEEQEKANAQR